MAAFMRMFMDLVGIFNEDQSLSEDGKIPAAGKSSYLINQATSLLIVYVL